MIAIGLGIFVVSYCIFRIADALDADAITNLSAFGVLTGGGLLLAGLVRWAWIVLP